jgi:hypothetical protein
MYGSCVIQPKADLCSFVLAALVCGFVPYVTLVCYTLKDSVNLGSVLLKFRSPSLFYPLTVAVEVVYFHFITLRHTPQSVGVLWTRDRPVAETST